MPHKNMFSTIAISLAVLAACGGKPSTEIDRVVKDQIDCLASQTVVSISDTIKNGIAAGQTIEQLKSVEGDNITAGLAALGTVHTDDMHSTYFKSETKRRLTAIQNAIITPSPISDDQQVMDETFAIASACVFKGG